MNCTQRVLADVQAHGPTTAKSAIERLAGAVRRSTVVTTLARLARYRDIAATRTERGITVYVARENRRALPPRSCEDPAAMAAWNAWLRSAA